jgi:hypothetical protein
MGESIVQRLVNLWESLIDTKTPPSTLWADVFVWGSVILWLAVATLFVLDSIRTHARSRREYARFKPLGNGRRIVAKRRLRISNWSFQGASVGLLVGILAFIRLLMPDLNALPALLMGAYSRVLIVYMFFCFWRAKRNNILMYEEAIEQHNREVEGAAQRERSIRTAATAEDTNVRVREMQSRGLSDQVEERVDRAEGSEHRDIDGERQALNQQSREQDKRGREQDKRDEEDVGKTSRK